MAEAEEGVGADEERAFQLGINELRSAFPHAHDADLASALRSCGGDLSDAAAALAHAGAQSFPSPEAMDRQAGLSDQGSSSASQGVNLLFNWADESLGSLVSLARRCGNSVIQVCPFHHSTYPTKPSAVPEPLFECLRQVRHPSLLFASSKASQCLCGFHLFTILTMPSDLLSAAMNFSRCEQRSAKPSAPPLALFIYERLSSYVQAMNGGDHSPDGPNGAPLSPSSHTSTDRPTQLEDKKNA